MKVNVRVNELVMDLPYIIHSFQFINCFLLNVITDDKKCTNPGWICVLRIVHFAVQYFAVVWQRQVLMFPQ